MLWTFWTPADDIQAKEDRDKGPYADWIADGRIEATPGRRVDYAYICIARSSSFAFLGVLRVLADGRHVPALHEPP